jgi:membrane-associated phospholipid phosphatase
MAAAPLLTQRRVVAAVIAMAGLVTALLGLHYAGARRAGHLDTAVDTRIRYHLRGHLSFLRDLVAVVDPPTMILACAMLAAIFLLSGRRRLALLAAVGPAVAAGFTEFVLKPLIGRRLDDALSFPSGHTTAAAALAVVVLVALLGPSQPRWPLVARWAASVLAFVGVAAIATAMVAAGYHYATDTVGGLCVAVGVVLSVALAIDVVAQRVPART